jgi:hypothetical protein
MPSIDYDRFAARWESDEILKSLVDRYDGSGLVIKTNKQDMPVTKEKKKDTTVSKMAKHALKHSK